MSEESNQKFIELLNEIDKLQKEVKKHGFKAEEQFSDIRNKIQVLMQDSDSKGSKLDKISIELNSISGYIGNFAQYMENTTRRMDFLHQALDASKSTTLSLRMEEYTADKERLSKVVVRDLMLKIQELGAKSETQNYLILLDSGSTMVYFILELLKNSIFIKDDYKDLSARIHIGTHNHEATRQISLKRGKINVPALQPMGYVSDEFGAVSSTIDNDEENANKLTEDSLTKLLEYWKTKHNHDTYIFSVLTGNYVSTEEGIITRGIHHKYMKELMMDKSDFVYLLTPLSKLVQLSVEEFQGNLNSNKTYLEFNWDKVSTKKGIRFYTTKRPEDYLSSKLIDNANEILNLHKYWNDTLSKLNNGSNFLDRFENSDVIIEELAPLAESSFNAVAEDFVFRKVMEYEFPNKDLRNYVHDLIQE